MPNASIRRSSVGPLVVVALAVTVWSAAARRDRRPSRRGTGCDAYAGWHAAADTDPDTDRDTNRDTNIFAGNCGEGDPDLRGVEFCAIVTAHCAACAMLNAFDDLNLDCDQLDDQVANGSCPFFAVASPSLTNADCFPSSIPDSAPRTARICIALANAAPDTVFTPLDYQSMPEECKPYVNPICR